jgi:hypothetical protein
MRIEESPLDLKRVKKIKRAPDPLRPGAFCNTMFSDTGRKEAAILVRCFLCFLVRRVPAYMVSCFVVFEDLTPLFAQLPLPKNKIVFQEQKNQK